MAVYKVEPYVVAADVYAVAPHTGRGGWTWYTGSAGWMYRLIIESLLGLVREKDRLRFTPLLPADWDAITIRYRYGTTLYVISVRQEMAPAHPSVAAATTVTANGIAQPGNSVQLVDDQGEHRIEVTVQCAVEEAMP